MLAAGYFLFIGGDKFLGVCLVVIAEAVFIVNAVQAEAATTRQQLDAIEAELAEIRRLLARL